MRTHKVTIDAIAESAHIRHNATTGPAAKQFYAGMVYACGLIDSARKGKTERVIEFVSKTKGMKS